MIQKAARDFARTELLPGVIERDEKQEVAYEQRKKLGELGFLGMMVSPEYGGGGLGSLAQVLVWEELSRTVALPSRGQGIFGPEVRPILYALNPEQKKRFMDPVLARVPVASGAISVPHSRGWRPNHVLVTHEAGFVPCARRRFVRVDNASPVLHATPNTADWDAVHWSESFALVFDLAIKICGHIRHELSPAMEMDGLKKRDPARFE